MTRTIAAQQPASAPVRVWDVMPGRRIGIPFTGTGPVVSVAFSPDGQTLATVGDKGTALWNLATGSARVFASSSAPGLAWSPGWRRHE